jgi:cytochrome c peroxidase
MRLPALIAALVLGAGATLAAEGWHWSIPDWLPPPPVPDDNPMTAAKVDLGRHLFYDARLSADGTVACASCHDQAMGFAVGRTTAIGLGGTLGHRNAPGLANVGYLPVLTWGNPLIDTLERQALIPMFGTAPVEMGGAGQEQVIFDRLSADPHLQRGLCRCLPPPPRAGPVHDHPRTGRLSAHAHRGKLPL